LKTIVCEKPNRFVLREDALPARGAGESLPRIRRIGICETDLHAFEGDQPYFTYPRVLGHELSGEIEEVDERSHGLQPGDNVGIVPYLACGTRVSRRLSPGR